jgi:hypothetical protein
MEKWRPSRLHQFPSITSARAVPTPLMSNAATIAKLDFQFSRMAQSDNRRPRRNLIFGLQNDRDLRRLKRQSISPVIRMGIRMIPIRPSVWMISIWPRCYTSSAINSGRANYNSICFTHEQRHNYRDKKRCFHLRMSLMFRGVLTAFSELVIDADTQKTAPVSSVGADRIN